MTTAVSAAPLVLPSDTTIEEALVGAALRHLRAWLDAARPGLCGRLDDLPAPLMARVAERLWMEYGVGDPPAANVRLLVTDVAGAAWQATWTEAVRLRNPDEEGARRPPLLLLVPPGSELLGSLDTDTFTAIACDDLVRGLVKEHIAGLPAGLRPVAELLARREIVRMTSDVQRLRYLLALEANGATTEAAGLGLCLLGLWPHATWLESGDQRDFYLSRNIGSTNELRKPTVSLLERVYGLRLKSETQSRRLYELLASEPAIEVAAICAATDPAWRDLDFGAWEFASTPTSVTITVEPLDLPRHEDGYAVLDLAITPVLPLAWSSEPSPAQAPALTHYIVELVPSTAEGFEAAYTSETITAGKLARKSVRLKDLRAQVEAETLPAGLYRARVTAWARTTNITARMDDLDGPHLSEPFWIEAGQPGDDPGTPPPTRERLVANYLEARRLAQWTLLDKRRDPGTLPAATLTWDGGTKRKALQSTCVVKFGGQGFRIRLSTLLRRVETEILTRPATLGALQAALKRSAAPSEIALSERSDLPRLAPDDDFLAARSALFARIRGDGQGTVETADLLALRAEIREYARQYTRLLSDAERDVADNPKLWPERAGLATIDTIRLTLPGLAEESSVALLLAPTHPLRLLWLLQLALLSDAWLSEAWQRGSPQALSAGTREALNGGLQPANFPPVLFDRRRVGYLQAGALAPGWDIYLPADIGDKRAAIARLSRAIGGTTPAGQVGVRARDLAHHVLRYLRQHPYIGQLQLNVFNPGDGTVIEELLTELDKEFPELRYDIRLFAPDHAGDDLGTALDHLVNPEVTVGEAAEKYSQAGKHPLHPNLSYSKNALDDFARDPRRFQAHLSILLDVFRPRIEVAAPFSDESGSRLFGLLHEEAVRYLGQEGAYAWERQVLPGVVGELAAGAEEAGLLSEALAATQRFVAALGASPASHRNRTPTVRLDLTVEGQNLLFEVHRVSDWVLTVDRHLGLEYFDSAALLNDRGAPGILLDVAPAFPEADHPLLLLTTRVDQEVERLVAPTLQELGLEQPGHGIKVIEWLRSLSGRLAMHLLAAPPAASQGVVGMALARAFLERLGLLADTLIIPVDAHVGLLRSGTPEGAGEQRTDLILVRHAGPQSQIEFLLVEVKSRGGSLTPFAYGALREEIETQLAATQQALAALFDPLSQAPDVIERPLHNLLLGNWLRFYAGRARRYGLLRPAAETACHALLAGLDQGYTVSFRQVGLLFELGRDDDLEDNSGEVKLYRIGRRSCERLLRGEHEPQPLPPTWDRVQETLRGVPVWQRQTAAPQEPSSLAPSAAGAGGSEPAPGEWPGTEVEPPTLSTISPDGQSAEGTGAAAPAQTTIALPACQYLVGETKLPPQWGLIGRVGSEPVGLDLNGTNTLSLFGVQGGGKSYTMGAILEMALRPIPGLNVLPRPLAAVVFHYNESQDYAPEFVTMARPNQVAAEVNRLRDEYGAQPLAIHDLLVLAPEDKVAARRREFPKIAVEPIAFHPSELTIQDWRFLMGAVGNDSLYIRQLNVVMRLLRDNITVESLRQGIETSDLSEAQRRLARIRLGFAEQFVRDSERLRDKLYPGRLVIVDLRDELIETDEALGLFVVMLRVFAGATHEGHSFNKWIAFDEAHKYIRNPDLVDSVVEVIRQMRHQATSVLIASQDPASLPLKIMELSSLVMLHRMDSPGWLKHIQRAITALGDLSAPALARLRPGEAYLWARTATDPLFTHRAVKIQCRPRVTQHGGATKAATAEAEELEGRREL